MTFFDRILIFLGLKGTRPVVPPPAPDTGTSPDPDPRPTPPKPRPHPPVDGDTIPSDPFHQFFTWLEDTPEYKEIYKRIERASKNVCLSCKQPVDVADALPLHSPLAIHRHCYEKLYDDLASTSSVEEAHRRFQDVPGKVSLLYWTLTHWPTYPPDWEIRRRRILERDHYTCQKCGESEELLHVHHKKPIEDGGLHTSKNLICLCWHCHEEEHGHPVDIHTGRKGESGFSKKMRILNQAMQGHKSVHFHYRDQKNKETDRNFTPQSWPNPNDYHGAVCISGYCHLRHDLRTFIVHRISRLTINE